MANTVISGMNMDAVIPAQAVYRDRFSIYQRLCKMNSSQDRTHTLTEDSQLTFMPYFTLQTYSALGATISIRERHLNFECNLRVPVQHPSPGPTFVSECDTIQSRITETTSTDSLFR